MKKWLTSLILCALSAIVLAATGDPIYPVNIDVMGVKGGENIDPSSPLQFKEFSFANPELGITGMHYAPFTITIKHAGGRGSYVVDYSYSVTGRHLVGAIKFSVTLMNGKTPLQTISIGSHTTGCAGSSGSFQGSITGATGGSSFSLNDLKFIDGARLKGVGNQASC